MLSMFSCNNSSCVPDATGSLLAIDASGVCHLPVGVVRNSIRHRFFTNAEELTSIGPLCPKNGRMFSGLTLFASPHSHAIMGSTADALLLPLGVWFA